MASMADDYENLEPIIRDVTNWGKNKEIFPTRIEIVNAIEGAIAKGYAQSFLLSSHPPHSTPVEFDSKRVDDLYFYLTPAGKKKTLENAAHLGVSE